jgi:hypothetical protein
MAMRKLITTWRRCEILWLYATQVIYLENNINNNNNNNNNSTKVEVKLSATAKQVLRVTDGIYFRVLLTLFLSKQASFCI